MSDLGRQSVTDKAAAAVKPDSEKSTPEHLKDKIVGKADNAAGHGTSENDKSFVQSASDAIFGEKNAVVRTVDLSWTSPVVVSFSHVTTPDYRDILLSRLHPRIIMTHSNTAEQAYLDLCQHIITHGEHRPDRTGTGIKSVFAPPQLRFDLSNDSFPLLTTKKVYSKAIIHELLWFIAGDTDASHLSEKGVKIWEGNGSREYLDKLGLTDRRVGDLGPVYGFQWRHFGAQYKTCDDNYTGQGFDQLQDVIKKLKTNPYDRRIIMSAWNPPDFAQMALPPCHVFCQFYVSFPDAGRPKLSCLLYQRSCDMGLGVPFNIASYALLTRMIAHIVDMDCGEFIHTMGDAHVYVDHIDALKEQLQRAPREFPKLYIKEDRKSQITSIDDFTFSDFEIANYDPYGPIKMKMSV